MSNPIVDISISATASATVQLSWGDVLSGNGWAMNVPISTTAVSFPAVGVYGAMAKSLTINNIDFYLDQPLPSGNLSCYFIDSTTGGSVGPAPIATGSQHGRYSVSPTVDVSVGDQVIIQLSLDSGSFVLPYIQWQVNGG